MCWPRIKQLLLDPVKAVEAGKREKNFSWTLEILIIEWLLAALGVFILLSKLTTNVAAVLSLSVLVIGIFSTLFFAFLIQFIFHVLGGKGRYLGGLMTAVYGKFPIIVGFLLASILSYSPVVGVPIGIVAALVFVVSGLATFYRAAREFFAIDLLTAWIGLGLLLAAVFLTVYLIGLPLLLSKFPQLTLPLTMVK
jgi:hypothetical protein